uniref:Protein sleepless n=1 Tax=Panagrellus redivivus TaxID=6233 RepID=A0A7E4URT5_PANRE
MSNCLTVLVLIALLPILTVGLKCVMDGGGEYASCTYCGYTKMTMHDDSIKNNSQIDHQCLSTAYLTVGDPYTATTVNKCYQYREEGQYPIDIELYICDKDLCNTHCDASTVGLGFALLLGAGLTAYFTRM